ncbi:MAG: SirB2 family protein [Gammaproteobacteria bacterium]|nr:SirB2 family protein [Gammaproteobacteria bacterium]
MSSYYWVKLIHIITIIISFSLFFIRGYWVLVDSSRLDRPWVKVLPHVNDSILLLSAITLTVLIAQYPFVQAWLTLKVVLLLIYIALGMVAIKRGRAKPIRVGAWLAALAVFAYIVMIALTKSANPFGIGLTY